ncbi:hypothetical protein JM946_29520 [Steroidobacter sp. S1-65]|uniref:SGNH/GDSL hydrolase family protein n=1 Tax=Steroidobacter gossypii TaxID=2805490 RepID=A0ABS1X6N3_9GAMM|nr:hypothetical protein [Steroidobacter gossypii]MBM0108888.1 hypothetical protein [Steroidobacter gossypii]
MASSDALPPTRRFILAWLLVCGVTLSAVVIFNAAMDPYLVIGTPRIDGLNARKPAADQYQHMMKAHEVLRSHPRTVILGSSRVAIGLEATNPAWPPRYRPVYNLAMSAADPYTSYRYLQHVLARNPLELVVLCLDFEFFLTNQLSQRPPETQFIRLSVTDEGGANPAYRREQFNDTVAALLSLDALGNSVKVLAANRSVRSSNTLSGDWEFSLYQHPQDSIGFYPMWLLDDVLAVTRFHGVHEKLAPMQSVRDILELCAKRGTRVIVIINPYHADMLEVLDYAGHWETFEKWKRRVLHLAMEYSAEPNRPVDLWDMNTYSPYTTESIYEGSRGLQWFINCGHYTRSLGDRMVRQIFSPEIEIVGQRLTPQNLEAHLAEIRTAQRDYRNQHRSDVERMLTIYREFAREQ